MQSLMDEITDHLSPDKEAYYGKRGIPYRRSFLFHGPQATGKTSVSLALAGQFNLDLHLVSMADTQLTDSSIAKLFASVDKPSIILLEDKDSAVLTREKAANSVAAQSDKTNVDGNGGTSKTASQVKPSQITLSGLLNALDGVTAPDGAVIIVTTNHPEALDPALTRPGRVDKKIAFQNVNKSVAKKIFKRVIGERDGHDVEALAVQFAEHIPDGKLSPAEIQGYLMDAGGEPQSAVKGAGDWITTILEEKHKAKKKSESSSNEDHWEDTKKPWALNALVAHASNSIAKLVSQ